jgi:hypothetical protein
MIVLAERDAAQRCEQMEDIDWLAEVESAHDVVGSKSNYQKPTNIPENSYIPLEPSRS